MSQNNMDDFVVRSFKIRKRWVLMIDRMAYWSREDKQVLVDKALGSFFKPFENYIPELPAERAKWKKDL